MEVFELDKRPVGREPLFSVDDLSPKEIVALVFK